MRDVRVVIGASAGFLRGYRLVCLLLAGVFLTLSGSDSIQAQVVQNPRRGAGEEMDIRNGAFSPSPRELRQLLLRAQKLIDQEKYADAVEMLRAIPDEDFFLGKSPETGLQLSAKLRISEMLSKLPSKGRELYELSLGAEARKALEDAIRSRDLEDLANVSSRYLHTKAGIDATFLLGRLQLQLGQPAAAAITLQRLSASSPATASYDPELSLLHAIAWHRSGRPEKALEVLLSLKQRLPNAKFTVAGVSTPLFAKEEEAKQWLTNWIGELEPSSGSIASQWTMVRGNESRSALVNAGVPLTYFRWSQPLVYDRQDEDRVKQSAKNRRENGKTSIPALQPLIVGDQVFMRTPDRVVGVDLKTGRALWVYPWDETNYERVSKAGVQNMRSPLSQSRERELGSRLWQDNNFGQMSSDGERLFLVDELAIIEGGLADSMRFMPAGRGGQPISTGYPAGFSKLVALSLKKQGALQWVVGGESGGDEPALAGAFFLGAPLPSADKLYALVDVSGEVRMVCLDAASGRLLWKQALVSLVERNPIERDRNRRIAGTAPSLANGILICPTSAEAVIAIDLATRSLLWGHQYAKGRPVNVDPFDGGNPRFGDQDQPIWIDSSVIIVDGTVILTPIDAPVMMGLDLFTGKPRWPNIDRGDMLFVGCIHRQTLLMVGKKQVQAFSLADGKPAWKEPISLEEEQPSGRGFYNGEFYFLPTSGQQLLKIDVAQGTVVERVKTQSTLGNLVAYKEDLISQGTDQVSAFYMVEPLQHHVEERLAKDAKDSWALARQGELLFQAGKPAEALSALRQAVASDVNSDSARLQLSRVMLALLTSDYKTYKGLREELEKLVDSPEQNAELLKTVALGLEAEGDFATAFSTYLKLADQLGIVGSSGVASSGNTNPMGLWEIARGHSISPTRWIQARLLAVSTAADETAKQAIAATVAARAKAALEDPSLEASRRFLDLLGFHPSAEGARLARATRLIQTGHALEVELALGELATSDNSVVAGTACLQLAKMYVDLGRVDLAAAQYERLQTNFAQTMLTDGKSGADWAQWGTKQMLLQEYLAGSGFAGGKVKVVTKLPNAVNATGFNTTPYPVQFTDVRGAASHDLRVGYIMQMGQLRVRPSGNQNAITIPLRTTRGSEAGFSAVSNILPGRMSGHSVLISNGVSVLAVDLLRRPRGAGDAILWQLEVSELERGIRQSFSRSVTNPMQSNAVTNNFIAVPTLPAGPITSRGVGLLRGKQLLCVDAMTGKTVWERSGIEPGSELFGDEQVLVVALAKSDDCLVLSMVDGSTLDRRKIDKVENRWAICGRNVLAWERVSSALRLRLYDATGQVKALWSEQFPNGSKGTLIGTDELAVLTPDGTFTVVSLKSGEVLVKSQILPETRLDGIIVHKSMGQYTVMVHSLKVDSSPSSQYAPISLASVAGPKVNGPLYGIDAKSGKMVWQVPAQVEQQGWLIDQPLDQPVLLFGKNQIANRQGNRAGGTCSIMAIDRRDGSLICELPSFAGTAINYEVNYDRSKQELSLKLMSASQEEREVKFQFSSEPAPPQPPAQTGTTSSLAPGRPRGNSEGVFGAILGAINRTKKTKDGTDEPEEEGDGAAKEDPFGGPFK